MIVPLILMGTCVLIIYQSDKRLKELDEEELNEFYRTCFETEAIMEDHYRRLATKEDETK